MHPLQPWHNWCLRWRSGYFWDSVVFILGQCVCLEILYVGTLGFVVKMKKRKGHKNFSSLKIVKKRSIFLFLLLFSCFSKFLFFLKTYETVSLKQFSEIHYHKKVMFWSIHILANTYSIYWKVLINKLFSESEYYNSCS